MTAELHIAEPDDASAVTIQARIAEQSGYHLIRSLGSGSYGTAFLATELATGKPVEVRHLSLMISDQQRADLHVRLRLCRLLAHHAARALRDKTSDDHTPSIVVGYGGDENFAQWTQSGSPCLAEIVKCLHGIVECLNEAHSLGLTHGGLTAESIGVAGGQPRLDFSGFDRPPGSPILPSIGSLTAKAADRRAFATLLAYVLDLDGFDVACRAVSRRAAAKLGRLAAAAHRATMDSPKLRVFAACLRTLARPKRERTPGTETTEELQFTPRSPVSDSKSQIMPVERLLDEVTSEIGLSSPAVLGLSTPRREPTVGDRLGRFRLDRKLGEGGMGLVFQATDLGTDEAVAIKILSRSAILRGNAVRRFAKEARLLASLNNPYITNLIDVCDEGGVQYIALEFVAGTDLKRTLKHHGPLTERAALAIAADVARALVDAHQREIVHRDIKPENVLLVNYTVDSPLPDPPPRAKLADFGIARHIDQSESLAVTQAGSLLGTPLYMSPEQCKGSVGAMPQSDVYSLGVTLFELLSGAPPFAADDPLALVGKHCFDAPPSLKKLNRALSEPVVELVHKCLAKRPEDRYADASHLLKELDRLLRGEPSLAALRPVLPAHDPTRVVSNSMTWELNSSPQALWPYVSNTERLNRAIGLPPVAWRTEPTAAGGVRRFGKIRLAGILIGWEEHPFEWVESRRMSVLREFNKGPFHWFVSSVELKPLANDRTELTHIVKILPRNAFGKIIARIETGSKCRKSLSKVYRRIDKILTTHAKTRAAVSDAFEPSPRLTAAQRERVSSRSEQLLKHGANPEAVERLAEFLLTAPPQEVAKIRPLKLADRLGMDEDVVLDTCLGASVHGMLQMQWDILCPTCRVAADTRDTLKQLTAHTHCQACDYDFKSDLASAIELVFRAAPDIRHSDVGQYCVGGPWHAPHVVAQLRLEPGERLETELSLSMGDYVLRGPRLPHAIALRVQEQVASSQQLIVLAATAATSQTYSMRSGNQLVTIENGFDSQQIVRVERTIPRVDVVTAARAASMPRFRELFPGEVLDSGRLVAAQHVTLLTAGISSIDELYADRGDAQAYALVEGHLARVSSTVRRFGGDVIKIVGETVFAAFDNSRKAMQAAFELGALSESQSPQPVRLSIGVHSGTALVTTANNRLDYFGATARQATALPMVAGTGIALTEPVFADPEAARWLEQNGRAGKLLTVDLPGKPRQLIQLFGHA